MSTPVGVWIDHRRAFLVLLNQTINSKTIHSKALRPRGSRAGIRTGSPFGHEDILPEDRISRRYRKHLDEYYQKVMDAIGDTDEIYLIGPGEAKTELKTHLLRNSRKQQPKVIVENADKMTDAQIIARVRDRYQHRLQ